jgi:hypothetical protein
MIDLIEKLTLAILGWIAFAGFVYVFVKTFI